MKWYKGSTLLHELENIHISSDYNHIDTRMPIQYVIRPHKKGFQDFRSYTGKIESGILRVGDKVKALPSGFSSTILKISNGEDQLKEAFYPMSVSVELEDDIDISRGDMIVKENNLPVSTQEIDLIVTWLNENPLVNRRKVLVKHTTNETIAQVTKIVYEININTLNKVEGINELKLNSIGRIRLKTAKPLFVDNYQQNRFTGSLILIDLNTNETIGAAIIR